MNKQTSARSVAPAVRVALVLAASTALMVFLFPRWRAAPDHAPPKGLRSEPQTEGGGTATRAPAAAPPEARADRHSLVALNGMYDVKIVQRMDAMGSRDVPQGELVVAGALALARHRETQGRAGWLVGRFKDVRVTGDEAIRRPFSGGREDLFEGPFAVRFDATGRVVERRFSPGTRPGVRNTINAVVLAAQVADRDADADGNADGSWEAIEPNPNGTHRAKYVERADGGLRKTWSLSARGAHAAISGGGVLEAAYTAGLLSAATIRWDTKVEATLTPAVPQRYSVQVVADLKWTGPAPIGGAEVELPTLQNDERLQPKPKRPLPKPSGQSISSLLDASRASQAKLDWQGRKAAMLQIAADIKSDPAKLAEVAAQLRVEGLDGDPLRTLIEALVAAKSPAAMQELEKLMGDKKVPRIARHSAVTMLTSVQDPSPALLQAARTVSLDPEDGLAPIAIVALGGQVRVQETRNPALSAQLRAELTARAAKVLGPAGKTTGQGSGSASPSASTDWVERCKTWVRALRNMSGDGIWPHVKPFLLSQDAGLRRAAIEATAEVSLPEARIALAKAMQKDPEQHNRAKAASVALLQPQWIFEKPVLRALREDPSPDVRVAAAHTVAVWSTSYPGLTKEITQAVEREKNIDAKNILIGLIHQQLSDDGKPL